MRDRVRNHASDIGFLRSMQFDGVIEIDPRPTLVAMATKI